MYFAFFFETWNYWLLNLQDLHYSSSFQLFVSCNDRFLKLDHVSSALVPVHSYFCRLQKKRTQQNYYKDYKWLCVCLCLQSCWCWGCLQLFLHWKRHSSSCPYPLVWKWTCWLVHPFLWGSKSCHRHWHVPVYPLPYQTDSV